MNCQDFEMLLSDALGGELADADRPAFEAHLAECERCRQEYESSLDAVQSMRELPGPANVTVRREGDRLVIAPTSQSSSARAPRFGQTLLRYAASILIAFGAGYFVHAARTPDQQQQPVMKAEAPDDPDDKVEDAPGETLRYMLASSCAGSRSRTGIASCVSTVFGSTKTD